MRNDRSSYAFSDVLMFALLLLSFSAVAQETVYPDGHGGAVKFPAGAKSFADEVTSFEMGKPAARDRNPQNPNNLLGEPNYQKGNDKTYTTLGCSGMIVVRFQDNALVDVAGPDLYVFEIGKQVEPTNLWISTDGSSWIDVGKISGGRADVDIAPFVKPGDNFRYVKLKDLGSGCKSQWPGADIDAVGAIGSVLRLTLSGKILFDFDQAQLKPSATEWLNTVAQKIMEYRRARVLVVGHTDNRGANTYNMDLSVRRAKAVQVQLEKLLGPDFEFEVRGAGETEPVARNDRDADRARNRRVEITVFPAQGPQ